jgi:hypothetical protein
MIKNLLHAVPQRWKHLLILIIVTDLLVVVIGAYLFVATDIFAAPPLLPTATPGPLPTLTPTPWAGPPGGTSTPTPLLPPTATPTTILAQSGFPFGFTPTPRPTREPVYISLPTLLGRKLRDVPNINQVLYPEPFFAPGTNNACGPIALYAGLLGLGLDIDYQRVRDWAVSYGFNAEGISTSGIVNTAASINQERGEPYTLDYGKKFNTAELMTRLRRGEVVVVLLRVKRINGSYQVTSDYNGSIGHFLLVERINTKKRTVRFAGSTLGMEEVSLGDFVASWTSNPQAADPAEGWSQYLKNEPASQWALTLKPNK